MLTGSIFAFARYACVVLVKAPCLSCRSVSVLVSYRNIWMNQAGFDSEAFSVNDKIQTPTIIRVLPPGTLF